MSLAKELHEDAELNGIFQRSIKIYAVYDKKAMAFAHLSLYHQTGQALRAFGDGVNDTQSPFNKHPEDFQLFQIGEWNDRSGVITPLSNPVLIEEALSFQNKT